MNFYDKRFNVGSQTNRFTDQQKESLVNQKEDLVNFLSISSMKHRHSFHAAALNSLSQRLWIELEEGEICSLSRCRR